MTEEHLEYEDIKWYRLGDRCWGKCVICGHRNCQLKWESYSKPDQVYYLFIHERCHDGIKWFCDNFLAKGATL